MERVPGQHAAIYTELCPHPYPHWSTIQVKGDRPKGHSQGGVSWGRPQAQGESGGSRVGRLGQRGLDTRSEAWAGGGLEDRGEDQAVPGGETGTPGSPAAARPALWRSLPHVGSSLPCLSFQLSCPEDLSPLGWVCPRLGGPREGALAEPCVPRPRLSQDGGLCCFSVDQRGLSGLGSLPTATLPPSPCRPPPSSSLCPGRLLPPPAPPLGRCPGPSQPLWPQDLRPDP